MMDQYRQEDKDDSSGCLYLIAILLLVLVLQHC
jgi:hypothetical protein